MSYTPSSHSNNIFNNTASSYNNGSSYGSSCGTPHGTLTSSPHYNPFDENTANRIFTNSVLMGTTCIISTNGIGHIPPSSKNYPRIKTFEQPACIINLCWMHSDSQWYNKYSGPGKAVIRNVHFEPCYVCGEISGYKK